MAADLGSARAAGAVSLLLLVACEAAPRADVAGPVGVETRVRLLDADFVEFEGRRQATDFFLVEMRRRVRLADGDLEKQPWVWIEVGPDARLGDGIAMSALRQELYKAGIRFMK